MRDRRPVDCVVTSCENVSVGLAAASREVRRACRRVSCLGVRVAAALQPQLEPLNKLPDLVALARTLQESSALKGATRRQRPVISAVFGCG